DVDTASSVPIVVCDNPGTTHFVFTDELHARISELPRVASIKIPPVPGGTVAVRERDDARALPRDRRRRGGWRRCRGQGAVRTARSPLGPLRRPRQLSCRLGAGRGARSRAP